MDDAGDFPPPGAGRDVFDDLPAPAGRRAGSESVPARAESAAAAAESAGNDRAGPGLPQRTNCLVGGGSGGGGSGGGGGGDSDADGGEEQDPVGPLPASFAAIDGLRRRASGTVLGGRPGRRCTMAKVLRGRLAARDRSLKEEKGKRKRERAIE